jgi:FKBP-type peptidyl-prolyl cis-trans isomerase FkpA
MRRLIVAAVVTLIAVPALAAGELKTDDQKTLYSLGQIMARQISVFNLSPDELELVKQGLSDGVTGKTAQVDADAFQANIQRMAIARRNAEGERLAAKSKDFLEKAAKEPGAVKTASGLIYKPLKEGVGASPTPANTVRVNYRGTFIDGKEFDSSYKAGKPAEFELGRVIKCWTEGLQLMKPGGKARLICPPDIAYGERGTGAIPANATLVFEVELLDVVK